MQGAALKEEAMSIVTNDVSRSKNAAPKRASVFVRILDRIAEARMRRAIHEINRHRYLFEPSHSVGMPDRSELPFGR
jgi:hypothetical protein